MAVPWRYQARCPYFVTGSCEPTTTVSGLSSRPDCSGPAITRPVRQFHYSSKSRVFFLAVTSRQLERSKDRSDRVCDYTLT